MPGILNGIPQGKLNKKVVASTTNVVSGKLFSTLKMCTLSQTWTGYKSSVSVLPVIVSAHLSLPKQCG